jgi:hypothetical protein
MSNYYRVLPISTRQVSGIPLFLLWSDLFFRTSSSLFACISWTRLWYWEGNIKLQLEHGGMLPGLGEFFL